MDTWDAITSRRQARAYTAEAIPEDLLRRILEAGRRAPSARNSQPWDFVVVSDRDDLARLSGVWQGAGWTKDAAATIACVLPVTDDDAARTTNRFDLGQAAMQIMIAAAGFGVASGQASCRDQALARDVLGFPDDRECALLIALGFPADRPLKPIVKPDRRPFDEVIHFGRW